MPEWASLIDEDAFIRLAEAFGGTRLYIPAAIRPAHEISRIIGFEAALALSKRLGGAANVRIPLARELRARRYRADGRSNAQIARALGITECGVDEMFRRMPDAPAKGSNRRG